MLRLGHITYSNCIPVHGRFLQCGPPAGVSLVHGVPGELNRSLLRGAVDLAPASSIEFARHADDIRIIPDLSISAPRDVQTIQLVARAPLEELADGARIALPTASATSVVLLKIMMDQRFGIRPEYLWFDQEADGSQAADVQAALYIGDRAHHEGRRADRHSYDLAALWYDWTGLPFVFAMWQTTLGSERDVELSGLARALVDSREWSLARLPELAERYAPDYGWGDAELLTYWQSLNYGWSDELAAGLSEFYARAVELGAVSEAPEPVFVPVELG